MSSTDMIQVIRERITECVKKANSYEANILRTVLGEIQKVDLSGKGITEDEIDKIFRKFKQGVEETISILKEKGVDGDMYKYETEISIYDKFIQETLSVEKIVDLLKDADCFEKIREAKSDGQATGIAMGTLKKNGAKVLGKDVSEAVKKVRG